MALASLGGGGDWINPGQMTSIAQEVGDIKEAQANGVKLEPEAAEALINGLKKAQEQVADSAAAIGSAKIGSLPIGDSPVADVYKPVFAGVLSDPDQGAEAAFAKLKQELQDAIDTVRACVRDTEQTDADNAGGFGGVPA